MQLRLGVVPEHFSSPVFLYARDGLFAARGVDVEVVICEAGTGDMIARLQRGELDLAFCVTEGLVTAVANDPQPVRVVGTYVTSPLRWAVSTGRAAAPTTLADLCGGTIGISRYGSGSHIMALYLAEREGWNAMGSQLRFTVLHNLAGLAGGVTSGTADAFLWDYFTTKHLYDAGELRHIGDVVPPWSSFTIAARVDGLLAEPAGRVAVDRFLTILNEAVADFLNGMAVAGDQDPPSLRYLMERFKYSRADALAWFATVRYPADVRGVDREEMARCLQVLTQAGAVKTTDREPEELVDAGLARWI
ncbi:hypothetical protein IWQ60_004883 [Tieghemiomyces parasiticus]|uniref:Ca3427-like PBP 2 domain-containing protein n=1 Tax=Tieghemiomyces parasiticus TaxID=78921 RepID=A0A9W8A719_9FUNG|nr:hypothetical protein IWQ60_004883 [Tieghemiomyces parasiticus]